MVNDTDIIEEHIMIRETTGYDELSDVPVENVSRVLEFLRIVHNYLIIKKIEKK
jgi:hypothetical protein